MASQSVQSAQFYGGRNSFIAGRDKGSSDDVNAKVVSLKQRVDFLNTSFKEYKESISDAIKLSKEEILGEMRAMMEGLVEQKQQKTTKSYRRKVPKDLAVSCKVKSSLQRLQPGKSFGSR